MIVPPDDGCRNMVKCGTDETRRMQKALEQMNVLVEAIREFVGH